MEDLQNRLSYRLHIAFCGILYYNGKKGSDTMKTEKKVTFADIAAFTGFSKTTVSRYFNDPDSLTEENQAKIADALEKLNYKENKLAKVLANGKTESLSALLFRHSRQTYRHLREVRLQIHRLFGQRRPRSRKKLYNRVAFL